MYTKKQNGRSFLGDNSGTFVISKKKDSTKRKEKDNQSRSQKPDKDANQAS